MATTIDHAARAAKQRAIADEMRADTQRTLKRLQTEFASLGSFKLGRAMDDVERELTAAIDSIEHLIARIDLREAERCSISDIGDGYDVAVAV